MAHEQRLQCEFCGRDFPARRRGPRPKFCDPACKQAAYRRRRGDVDEDAPYYADLSAKNRAMSLRGRPLQLPGAS